MSIDKILLRVNLDDIGDIPSTGSACNSPDIIVHKEITDISELVTSYNRDISEAVNKMSRSNLIYTRVKNLSTESVSGRISVFRCNMSLFLHPSLWKDNALKSPEFVGGPVPYVTFRAEAGNVAASDYPLIIDGTKPNFCLVGMVSEGEPIIPPEFTSYDDFWLWAHQNRNIALRNMDTIRCNDINDHEGVYLFSNPENREVPCFINIIYEYLPLGTVIDVTSDYLNVDDQRTKYGSSHYGIATYVAANSYGVVKMRVNAAKGTPWPPEATVRVEVLVGRDVQDPSYFAGISPNSMITDDQKMVAFLNYGKMKLVPVGSCGVNIIGNKEK